MAIKSISVLLNADELDRIIGMAWEDRTPFDAIKSQFGLTEQQVRELMRATLKPGSYRAWRRRMERLDTKHQKLRAFAVGRFKSQNQKVFR